MRLIDADELVKYYKRLSNECFSKDNHEYANLYDCVCAKIMTQPTAYNVEKVVEELEMLSTEVKMILPFSKEAIETKVIASGDAIEIIRMGGKNEM